MEATIMRPVRFCRKRFADFVRDRRGIAATEFAVIVPIMLVLFFGTVEFSQGVAVNRKVTILARTLSDLTSQNTSVNDTLIGNIFTAGTAILTPYPVAPVQSTISELYIDPNTHTAKVQWSKGYSPLTPGSAPDKPVPTALLVDGTYLIYSEVKYLYQPTIGYVMAKAGVNLSDVAYTRPRQSVCVLYGTTTCPTN
jgi:Flp pilus assembly protein TadG